MKNVCLVQDGFLYRCGMQKRGAQSFPAQKFSLKESDVLAVKAIVDKVVLKLTSMTAKSVKEDVEECFFKEPDIPFWKNKEGKICLRREAP